MHLCVYIFTTTMYGTECVVRKKKKTEQQWKSACHVFFLLPRLDDSWSCFLSDVYYMWIEFFVWHSVKWNLFRLNGEVHWFPLFEIFALVHPILVTVAIAQWYFLDIEDWKDVTKVHPSRSSWFTVKPGNFDSAGRHSVFYLITMI